MGAPRAKTFFLSMLDTGGVNHSEIVSCDIPLAAGSQYSWINDQGYLALSIDEILIHAAFLRSSSNSECLFCFRSSDELDKKLETGKKSAVDARKTAAAIRIRLENLGMLRKLLDGYSSLTSFSIFALSRLWEIIMHHHGPTSEQPARPFDEMKSKQETILAFYSSGYVETAQVREKLCIFEKAALSFPCHLICSGSSGSGKTCMAAHISASKLQQGTPCIYYFGGFGDDIVPDYLCSELSRTYMLPLDLQHIKDPAEKLECALKAAAIHLRKEEFLFLVLDNLSPADASVIVSVVLRLSKDFRIRCIFNMSQGNVVESFQPVVKEWSILEQPQAANTLREAEYVLIDFELDSLQYTKQERMALAEVMCRRFDINLDKRIKIQMLGQDITPISLFIYSLTARSSSSRISRNPPKINVSAKSLEDLFAEAVLERSEFGWERDVVDDIICFLAICRRGLPLALVVEMVQKWESSSSGQHTLMNVLLPLRPFLKPWALVCTHLEYLHSAYKLFVLERYCVDSNRVKDGLSIQKITNLHKKISTVLISLADPDSDLTWRGFCSMPFIDLVYHLYESVMGDHKDRASLDTIVEVVCNLRFISSVIVRHPLKSSGLLEQYELASNILKTLRDLEDVSKSLQADAIDAQIQQVHAFEDFIRSQKDLLDANQGSLMLLALQSSNEIVRTRAVQELDAFCSLLRENIAILQNLLGRTKSEDMTIETCCSLLCSLGKMRTKIAAYLELGCLQVLSSDEQLYAHIEYLFFEVTLNLRSAFLSKLKINSSSSQQKLLLNENIDDRDTGIDERISKLEAISLQMTVCNAVPWTDLGHSWEILFTRKSFHIQFSDLLTGSTLNSIRQILFRNMAYIENLFLKYRLLFSEESNTESETVEAYSLNLVSESSTILLKAIWVFLEDYALLDKNCCLSLVNKWGIRMQISNAEVPLSTESDWHKGEKIFRFQDFVEYILRIAQARYNDMPFLQALDKFCLQISSSAQRTFKCPNSTANTRIASIRDIMCSEELVSLLRSDVEGMLITHERRLLSCFEHFSENEFDIGDESLYGPKHHQTLPDIVQQNKDQSYFTLTKNGFSKLCKSIGLGENSNDVTERADSKLFDQDWDFAWEMTFVEFVGFVTHVAHVSLQCESLAESLRLWLNKLESVSGTQSVAFDPQAPAGSLWKIVGFRVRAFQFLD